MCINIFTNTLLRKCSLTFATLNWFEICAFSREEGRKTHQWLHPYTSWLGMNPNLSMCPDQESNLQPVGVLGGGGAPSN